MRGELGLVRRTLDAMDDIERLVCLHRAESFDRRTPDIELIESGGGCQLFYIGRYSFSIGYEYGSRRDLYDEKATIDVEVKFARTRESNGPTIQFQTVIHRDYVLSDTHAWSVTFKRKPSRAKAAYEKDALKIAEQLSLSDGQTKRINHADALGMLRKLARFLFSLENEKRIRRTKA